MNRQNAVLAIIGVFFLTLQGILSILIGPQQIPYPASVLVSVTIVGVVMALLVATFGLPWLTRSRALANFYRRPLIVILIFGVVEGLALFLLYYASYLHGLDVLIEENNLNATKVFNMPVTGAQLRSTFAFSIVEAFVAVFVLTFLIGYTLYMIGIDRQRVLQHQ